MNKGFKWMNEREKLLLKSARTLPYMTLQDGDELSIHFFLPKDFKEGPPRPVFLFFNSGAWDRGNVIQFAPQALYYVERGAVCGLVEYRNRASHPASRPLQSLQDGLAAVRYTRQQAEPLHLDRNRVIAVGAGAGGNIAACALMGIPTSGLAAESDPLETRPNAAVLISSIIEVNKGGYGYDAFADAAEARLLSLSRHVDSGVPPMLLIHGTADRLVPHEDAAEFAAKMERKKNPCDYVEFEGRDHHFFNLNVDPVSYEASLAVIDDFLDRRGILKKEGNHESPQLITWREKDY